MAECEGFAEILEFIEFVDGERECFQAGCPGRDEVESAELGELSHVVLIVCRVDAAEFFAGE